jgi:hypothetical protein
LRHKNKFSDKRQRKKNQNSKLYFLETLAICTKLQTCLKPTKNFGSVIGGGGGLPHPKVLAAAYVSPHTHQEFPLVLCLRGHSNNIWPIRGEGGGCKNVTWQFLLVISLVKVDSKCHMGGGGGSKKCGKSVTYYLNGPLIQQFYYPKTDYLRN